MNFPKEYAQCRIPGLLATKGGDLYAYCECRKIESDWAEIDLLVQRSTDGGGQYTEILKILGEGHTLNNPMMVEKDGRLYFFYCRDYSELFYRVSTDGVHFSDAVSLTDMARREAPPHTCLAVGPGHGIVTPQGAIVLPMWFANDPENPKSHRPSYLGSLYSEDGESFHIGEIIDTPMLKNPSECAMGILPNGKILLSIRHESPTRRRAFAVSGTGYSDWQDLHFDDRFYDPICQGSLVNAEGVMAHVHCHDDHSRRNLVLKVTRDGFESFTEYPIAEIGGYADVAILDGTAHVLYEETEHTPGSPLHVILRHKTFPI